MTTRNVLRSARFCLPMLWARRVIAHQLAHTPGLIRYAGGVAGPTEFLTLTVWKDKRAMTRFMQSGAHERIMWQFSRWTASFWSMRWQPSEAEIGDWDGIRLSESVGANEGERAVSPLVAVGLLPPNPPRAGPLGPRPESGAVEPRACGLFAVTARLEGLGSLARARRVRRLHSEAAANPDLVRWTVGLDWPPQALIVSVWRDTPASRARAFELIRDGSDAGWAIRWEPGDYEIGHWTGLRLRLAGRQRVRAQT